ncbi:MAG: LysR substrate-binding domain-containing protein [Burkholderiales bacterium]
MDRFEVMRAYVQIVDSGSYTRAAQQLNLHKATLSQQIRQLEDKLGTRLLTRTTRSIAQTSEGLAYYQHARAILQQVDEVETQLRKGTSAPAGHLRVDVPVAMGRLVFAPEIRHFLERYPKITLELGCSDRAVDLIQEGVDCALRGGPLPDSRLVARPVGNLPFVLCAAPQYVDAHGLPETPEVFLRHHRIGFIRASTGRMHPLQLTRDGRTVELDVPARFITTDSAAVLSAALDGLGITPLAEFVASHYLASGALVPVLAGWQCPSLPLHLVTPTARRRTARVQAFMDWAHALLVRRLGSQLQAV